MIEEDEAFNEIERRSIAKKDAVKAQLDKPQRTWVGLTDDEIDAAWVTVAWHSSKGLQELRREYARAIEAKLKEKNT